MVPNLPDDDAGGTGRGVYATTGSGSMVRSSILLGADVASAGERILSGCWLVGRLDCHNGCAAKKPNAVVFVGSVDEKAQLEFMGASY